MEKKEQKILKTVREFAKKLPKFPDGRIDYSNSDVAPVITIFVKYKDKVLLLRRSDHVGAYKGKWNSVAGYLDELKPLREKIIEELREELEIEENNILSIRLGERYKLIDKGKTWIVHPVLVKLKSWPEIKLDWEHVEYKWIKPGELKKFDIVPKLDESLKRALKKD